MAAFYTVTMPIKSSKIKPVVIVLAPGAGGSRRSEALVCTSKALADIGMMTVTFDFDYRMKGKKAPDSPSVLYSRFVDAIGIAVKKCAKECESTKIKVYIGGRSMGARIASVLASEYGTKYFEVPLDKTRIAKASITGLILLSYPLHAPGKKERKDAHFQSIKQKTIFISGDRDPFGSVAELKSSAKKIAGSNTCVILKGGDHELKTLKTSQVTFEELNSELTSHVVNFLGV